jgi:agmatinase
MHFVTAIVCVVLAATVLAHDHHAYDHVDQMPLNYVKYPYQAIYPGDNEGT